MVGGGSFRDTAVVTLEIYASIVSEITKDSPHAVAATSQD